MRRLCMAEAGRGYSVIHTKMFVPPLYRYIIASLRITYSHKECFAYGIGAQDNLGNPLSMRWGSVAGVSTHDYV